MFTIKQKNILTDILMGFPRGINYHFHTVTSTGMKPAFIELMITSKCNARCLMCNIWQTQYDNDITLKNIENVLSSSLFADVRWVTITGGESFLRRDLVQIIELINRKLIKVQEILIATNGFMTNIIISQTKNILDILKKDIRLRIGVSFDGIGEEHEKVRNLKGIHKCALETVKGLQKLQDARLYLQAHVAIGPYNVNQLTEMYDYYSPLIGKINWFPVMITNNYFNNQDSASTLALNQKEKKSLKSFLGTIVSQEPPSPSSYYYSKLSSFLDTNRRDFPCTGGYRFIQIDSQGNVHPCPVVPREFSFGNIKDKPIEEIWLSRESNAVRKKLRASGICERCPNHCDIFSVVREEFFDFMTFLAGHPNILKKMMGRYFHQ